MLVRSSRWPPPGQGPRNDRRPRSNRHNLVTCLSVCVWNRQTVEKETTATAIWTFSGCSREMMENPALLRLARLPRRGGFFFTLVSTCLVSSFRLCGDLVIVGNGAFDSIITHLNHFFHLEHLHFLVLLLLFSFGDPQVRLLYLFFLFLYIVNRPWNNCSFFSYFQ